MRSIDNIDKLCRERELLSAIHQVLLLAVETCFYPMISTLPSSCYMMDEAWAVAKVQRNELYGKTLCLFGIGNIASRVAVLAKAFGMDVIAYDKYVQSSPHAEMKVTPEAAVEHADYISLHLPLTDETRGMINKTLLSHCKKQPVIINTGRALCVDADDMVAALEDGSVAWYATDVYPTDPPAPDYPILKAENVTLTPHVGANSVENLIRIGEESFDIISVLIKGKLNGTKKNFLRAFVLPESA